MYHSCDKRDIKSNWILFADGVYIHLEPGDASEALSVLLMETLQKRFKVKATAAALKAAWITGFNEKTVRYYRRTTKDGLKRKSEANTRGCVCSMTFAGEGAYG